LGGRRVRDVKVLDDDDDFRNLQPFLSTIGEVFSQGRVGAYIRQQFPDKSEYEK
jgi:hypothetical protein